MSICLYVYMSICLYVYMSIDSSQSYVIQVRCMYHKSIPLTVDMYLRYVSNICPVYTLLNEYISNSFKVLLVGFKDHAKKAALGKGNSWCTNPGEDPNSLSGCSPVGSNPSFRLELEWIPIRHIYDTNLCILHLHL